MTYNYIVDSAGNTIPIYSYDISKVIYSNKDGGTVRLKYADAANLSIGEKIDVYLYDAGSATSKLVFNGIVMFKNRRGNYVDVDIKDVAQAFYNKFVVDIVHPSDVGRTDNLVDISDVVSYLAKKYFPDYTPVVTATGVTQPYFKVNDYLGKVFDRFAQTVNYVWYIEGTNIYFKPREIQDVSATVTIDNSFTTFDKWEYDYTNFCNEVHFFGGDIQQSTVELFAGDGVTTEFTLSYVPESVAKVDALYPPYNGMLDPTKYEVDKTRKIIKFYDAPPAISGNPIPQYENWNYKQKWTITFTPSASVTDPILLVTVSTSDGFPSALMRGDLKDVRFVDANSNDLVFVYLGQSGDTYQFAIKIPGTFDAVQNNVDIYCVFGNPSATTFPYAMSDIFTVYDEFNTYGDFDTTKWDITAKSYSGTTTDGSDWSEVTSDTYYSNYYVTKNIGYAKLTIYARAPTIANPDLVYGAKVFATTKLATNSTWIYWLNDISTVKVETATDISLVATCYTSESLGEVSPGTTLAYRGIYYVSAGGILTPDSVTLADYEPNSSYNIRVYYSFLAPLYVVKSDDTSISAHGVFSKQYMAEWVTDETTADALATQYLNEHNVLVPIGNGKMSLRKFFALGVDVGYKVHVVDNLAGVDENLLITKIRFNNGLVTLNVGGNKYDVNRWIEDVEARVRAIDMKGRDNFFMS